VIFKVDFFDDVLSPWLWDWCVQCWCDCQFDIFIASWLLCLITCALMYVLHWH
jgi:hypothetical protein